MNNVLLFEFFPFEEQERDQMYDQVHLRKTLGSRNELGDHLHVAIDAFMGVHTGEELIGVLDGIL